MKRNIDGKTTLCIEIEKGYNRSRSRDSQLVNQLTSEIIVDKKWMEKEEMKEKHLVEAIKNKSTIPVPDIVEIDETIYDKLYPANYKKTNWRIIAEPPIEKEVVYDLDSEDERWLSNQSKHLNLNRDKLEACFEYLEENSKNKVPADIEFYLNFKTYRPIAALESIYDYWLDKRLSRNGKKLIPELKKFEKITSKNKIDPYVAFRPCREKMGLRKNRHLDRENYVKMLRLREQMEANVRMWRNFMIQKKVEHQQTEYQFKTFLEQYQKKNFSEIYTSDTPLFNTGKILSDLKSKIEDVSYADNTPEVTLESVQGMGFACVNSFNKYYKPINLTDMNIDVDCEHKFYSSENGFIRPRIGRGGRIIIDRKFTKSNSSEFKQFNVLSEFNVLRYEPPPQPNGSTSSFKLSNSCTHKINFEDLRDQFYFEVE